MALTDDQKAMLRLLAQREHGYEDIAALTGEGVEDVRAKVKEALAALDRSGSPADDQKAMLRLLAQREQGYGDIAALTDQSLDDVRAKVKVALASLDELGGGAAPPAEDREPREQMPPAPPPKPAPPTPEPPPAPPTNASLGGEKKRVAPSLPRVKVPEDRGAAWGLGAGLLVVLVLVVLLATGALGGSGSESSSSSSSSSTFEPNTTSGGGAQEASSSLKPTQAVLRPVGGGNASGRALFGKDKKKVILLVQAKGLQPSPQGKSYTVSLVKSPSQKLPLVATKVTRAGTIEGSFQVAPQVLGLLASGFDTMEVSLVSDGQLGAALKAAKNAKKAPNYSGVEVLRGAVTGAIVEAGQKGEVKP
ncbi:MAG: hypothetical protein ACHQCF_06110 [Solirubrobacterales bacterium]